MGRHCLRVERPELEESQRDVEDRMKNEGAPHDVIKERPGYEISEG